MSFLVYAAIAVVAVVAVAAIVYFERQRIAAVEEALAQDVHNVTAQVHGEYDALVTEARSIVDQFEEKAETFLHLANVHEGEADAHRIAAGVNRDVAAQAGTAAAALKAAITPGNPNTTTPTPPVAKSGPTA